MKSHYCTIYSHQIRFNDIAEILKTHFANWKITIEDEENDKFIQLTQKRGLFRSDRKIEIPYRERLNPSYIIEEADCPVAENLLGMAGLVSTIDADNEDLKEAPIRKIHTINCEFSILANEPDIPELNSFVKLISAQLDAIVLMQQPSGLKSVGTLSFLDKNFNLILDALGQSEIETLTINVSSKYFENPFKDEGTADQIARKEANDELIKEHAIKVNPHLPYVGSEQETRIRSAKEISERIVALAHTNMVAFGVEVDKVIEHLEKYNIKHLLTEEENDFLNNPTEERKMRETWRCECIWTLMWALNIVDDLGFPDQMADPSKIPGEHSIGGGKDPNQFIEQNTNVRSVSEILNMNDLYYRLHWACVDARINNQNMETIIPGVVYERHYALNWLINYCDEEWDDVSTDT